MSEIARYNQQQLVETLERVSKRGESLASAVKFNAEDVSNQSVKKIHLALSLLDEVVATTLQAQKARGKEFLSDDDIDELFKRINLTYGQ